MREKTLTPEEVEKLKKALKKKHRWWLWDNCASYAVEVWEDVTGEDLEPTGLDTPRGVGRKIRKANGK